MFQKLIILVTFYYTALTITERTGDRVWPGHQSTPLSNPSEEGHRSGQPQHYLRNAAKPGPVARLTARR